MDYFELYLKKMNNTGSTSREANLIAKTQEFEHYFADSLNKEPATIFRSDFTRINTELIFQDHSQVNKLSDDKYVISDNSVKLNIGDFIHWRDNGWLVFTSEIKTIATHQQAQVKQTNFSVKWMKDGKVINDGHGYAAYVQSQTLYTMGVSETTYIDVPDGKMMMYMQNNADTRELRRDSRVFIGNKVFKIKFIDLVSRHGLISYLMDEDTIHDEYDNVELGVTEYWKSLPFDKSKKENDSEKMDDLNNPVIKKMEITGQQSPKIGSTQTYTTNFDVTEWVVESLSYNHIIDVIEKTTNSIKIHFKDDYRAIGNKVIIIANSDDDYVSSDIIIAKKY